jgi:hypothetical protein
MLDDNTGALSDMRDPWVSNVQPFAVRRATFLRKLRSPALVGFRIVSSSRRSKTGFLRRLRHIIVAYGSTER